MSTPSAALATVSAAPLAHGLPALVESARAYVEASHAPRTREAYAREWSTFAAWSASRGLVALPALPATVALYLTDAANGGRKPAGLDVALAAIGEAHKRAGHASPRNAAEVRAVRRGIRRTVGTAQTRKAPLLVGALRSAVEALPATLAGLRDRALLLVGFAGAFRRSELVGLDVGDVRETTDGLEVTLRRSKTDQEGAGRVVGLPFGSALATCPVRSLRAWLEAARIVEGAIFVGTTRHNRTTGLRLDGRDVARAVKRAALAAGLDARAFAGHSLRAGLATTAAKAGKSERAIMAQTGHRSVAMVRRYIRNAELFKDNAAAGIGL